MAAVATGRALMRPAEAAAYLGLSRGTLANWRCKPPKNGGPAWIGEGPGVRYDPDELDRWKAKHTRRSTR